MKTINAVCVVVVVLTSLIIFVSLLPLRFRSFRYWKIKFMRSAYGYSAFCFSATLAFLWLYSAETQMGILPRLIYSGNMAAIVAWYARKDG